MSDWEAVAARVKADIAADVEAAQNRALTASRVRAEVEQTRGVADVDGVRAEVDSVGRLVSLVLDAGVLSLGSEGVADAVLKAARAAHRNAAGRVAGIAEREFGEGSEFASRIRAEVESRLVPEPQKPKHPEAPPRSPLIMGGRS